MILTVLSVASSVAAAAVLVALMAIFTRRWDLAVRVTGLAFAAASGASLVLVTVVLLMWLAPRPAGWAAIELLVQTAGDPTARAKLLADGISSLVSSSAVALPACLFNGVLYGIARARSASAPA